MIADTPSPVQRTLNTEGTAFEVEKLEKIAKLKDDIKADIIGSIEDEMKRIKEDIKTDL